MDETEGEDEYTDESISSGQMHDRPRSGSPWLNLKYFGLAHPDLDRSVCVFSDRLSVSLIDRLHMESKRRTRWFCPTTPSWSKEPHLFHARLSIPRAGGLRKLQRCVRERHGATSCGEVCFGRWRRHGGGSLTLQKGPVQKEGWGWLDLAGPWEELGLAKEKEANLEAADWGKSLHGN